MPIHIGSIIQNYTRHNNIRPIDFYQGLQIQPSSIYKIFKGASISTRMLLRISILLKHDFFQYFQTELDQRINNNFEQQKIEHEQLKKDYENLKLENDLLKKIFNVPRT